MLCAVMAFAQNDFDTETGIRYFMNENYQSAVPYFQRAAKNGSLAALDYLGYMYEYGKGVEKNYTVAMNLYKKGEARNYPPCLRSIGRLYKEGHGVAKNLETAYSYFLKAAEQGESEGELYVYQAKLCGEGTEKDLSGALMYAERAANHGQTWLYATIGDMYYDGIGTEVDWQNALKWYTKKDGDYNNSTKLRVAEMLYKGMGTTDNPHFSISDAQYATNFYGDGINGRSCITQSLILLERLLSAGYEDARPLYNTVKAKYEERVKADNKIVAPKMTESVRNYLNNYRRPGAPAIKSAGYGEIQITFKVTSNGSISNPTYKKRVLVSMDEAAMRMISGMPSWIPGTKGGFDIDMKVTMGISWYPSKKIRTIAYSY